MIGYVTLGTNDFEKALSFYDQLLVLLDEKRLWSTDSMAAWGISREQPSLCISKPFDGSGATTGNGMMVAIKVNRREQVDAVHAKAIELGGTDEGPAGVRGTNGFYAGYFRDLDGNKLNVYIPADSV
jgi:predicted lactoylglutathione lyase